MTSCFIGWLLQHKLAVVVIGLLVIVFVRQLLRTKSDLRRAARESLTDDPLIWVLIVVLTLLLLSRAAGVCVFGSMPRNRLAVFIVGAIVILFLGWLLGDKTEPPPEEETGESPPGGVA